MFELRDRLDSNFMLGLKATQTLYPITYLSYDLKVQLPTSEKLQTEGIANENSFSTILQRIWVIINTQGAYP